MRNAAAYHTRPFNPALTLEVPSKCHNANAQIVLNRPSLNPQVSSNPIMLPPIYLAQRQNPFALKRKAGDRVESWGQFVIEVSEFLSEACSLRHCHVTQWCLRDLARDELLTGEGAVLYVGDAHFRRRWLEIGTGRGPGH